MSTTNPVAQNTAAAAAAAATAAATATTHKSANALNVSDFLTLMTTQLKNQDPFKPLDGTQMVAQLAQFGTVSGVQQMNTTLAALSDSLRSSQALSGATMVGHEILAPATSATYGGQQPLVGAVQVPAGASSVTLTISDSAGQVVRHLALSSSSGQQGFSWDGRTDGGAQAVAGNYAVAAIANVGGASEGVPVAIAARVTSVSIDSAGTALTLNTPELGAVALGKVQQII
jgi:flagellar basal-body rod modification protein FlgD